MKKTPLIVISGPSGSGKNTIIEKVKGQRGDLQHSISTTTRQPRGSEQHGVNYYFISREEFEKAIEQDKFLEYAPVLDRYYGTSRAEIDRIIAQGKIPILDIDVQGALQIKSSGIPCRLIFIMPPSLEVLRTRLEARGTEPPEQIAKRMELAVHELDFRHEYDLIIVNGDLDKAVQELDSYLNSLNIRP